MPGVKLLHQESGNNTKPEYIMGHSLQAVGMLVRAANSVFSVPLAMRIHEGLRWTNRDRRTLLDKMLLLPGVVALEDPYYFVADAFYAAGKMTAGFGATGNPLVPRAKSNAIAWTRHEQTGPRKRGRPTLYGDKIKLKSLFKALWRKFHESRPTLYWDEIRPVLDRKYGASWHVEQDPNFVITDLETKKSFTVERITLTHRPNGTNRHTGDACMIWGVNYDVVFQHHDPLGAY